MTRHSDSRCFYIDGYNIETEKVPSYCDIGEGTYKYISSCLYLGDVCGHNWRMKSQLFNQRFKAVQLIKDSLIGSNSANITSLIIHCLNDYLDDYLTFYDQAKDVIHEYNLVRHNQVMKNSKLRKDESYCELKKAWSISNSEEEFSCWIQPILSFLINFYKQPRMS